MMSCDVVQPRSSEMTNLELEKIVISFLLGHDLSGFEGGFGTVQQYHITIYRLEFEYV